MACDLNPIPVRIQTKKIVRSIRTFTGSSDDLDPVGLQLLEGLLEVFNLQGDVAHGFRNVLP
jgi:hypothetical protein